MTSRRAANFLGVASIVLILDATLWPFRFSFHALTWSEWIGSFGLMPATLLDLPRNILLFMPLGAGIALAIDRDRTSSWLIAALCGFFASVCVESLQIFLPGRTANVSDVLGNSLGSLSGLACVRAWDRKSRTAEAARLSMYPARIGSFWVALFVMLSWALMQGMRPSGWESSARLMLGDVSSGSMRWNGHSDDVLILDRAADKAETAELLAGRIPVGLEASVLAEYRRGNRPDTSANGSTIPDVSGAPRDVASSVDHVQISRNHTPNRQASLGGRVNLTGQFTAALTVTSFDLTQKGAEILAVVGEGGHRDLTISQDEARMILAWQSPLTRVNKGEPPVEFPGVLDSSEPERVVVTFDGHTATLSGSKKAVSHVVFLGPEAIFAAIIRGTGCWPVTPENVVWWQTTILWSVLAFCPLGVALGFSLAAKADKRYRASVWTAGLVPPLLGEVLIGAFAGRLPRVEIIGLNVFFTIAAAVTVRLGPAFVTMPGRLMPARHRP